MFVILLTFAENRDQAAFHMDAHKAWIKKGFDDGVFLVAGSLVPHMGGAILASGVSREQIDVRIAEDPFVVHAVVSVQIHEVAPAVAASPLQFMIG